MSKRLTTQTKLKRLRSEGYSRKQLARSFGVSVSSVGRAERGAKGTTISAQTDQFYKLGKRAKSAVVSGSASLPSAKLPVPPKAKKPEPTKEQPRVDPIRKAEGHLSQLDGDSKVVIYINVKGTGRGATLGAHGGIYVSTILEAPSVGDFFAAQAGDQGYEIEWEDVTSIVIEEYY